MCPAQKRHLCLVEHHFTQKHMYFAETIGFFVSIRAFRNEHVASKCGKSSPQDKACRSPLPAATLPVAGPETA